LLFVMRISRASKAILPEEFDYLVSKSEAKKVGNSYCVMHNKSTAGFTIDYSAGIISTSYSLTNPAFGDVFTESVEGVYKASAYLGASLCESLMNLTIDSTNIEEFSAAGSDYNQQLRQLWDERLVEINKSNRAPLEFVVGGNDSCSEYFCLNIRTDTNVGLDDIELALGLTLKRSSATAAVCYDTKTLRPHCKLAIDSANRLRIQPYYWKQAFSRTVTETFQIADLLQALFGGNLLYFETPLDSKVRSSIEKNSRKLGVDFASWLGMKLG